MQARHEVRMRLLPRPGADDDQQDADPEEASEVLAAVEKMNDRMTALKKRLKQIRGGSHRASGRLTS
jgi:hypothetical protein